MTRYYLACVISLGHQQALEPLNSDKSADLQAPSERQFASDLGAFVSDLQSAT